MGREESRGEGGEGREKSEGVGSERGKKIVQRSKISERQDGPDWRGTYTSSTGPSSATGSDASVGAHFEDLVCAFSGPVVTILQRLAHKASLDSKNNSCSKVIGRGVVKAKSQTLMKFERKYKLQFLKEQYICCFSFS